MQILVEFEKSITPMIIQGDHRVTDDEFYQFCADNPDLRAERTAEGNLVVMPPPGTETGSRKWDYRATCKISQTAWLRARLRKSIVGGDMLAQGEHIPTTTVTLAAR
jgi:hypothetical protein